MQLLGAENRIIAVCSENIIALKAGDGSPAWNIRGTYERVIYAGGKLYAIAAGGRLEVRDPLNGSLLWSREGITAISTDGATVIEETTGRRFIRNAERGTLIKEQRKNDGAILPMVWRYGTAYLIEETMLVPLYGPGKAWDAGENILAAAADIRGGAALTENSLILFDGDMRETRRIARAHHAGVTLSLSDEGVSVLDKGTLRAYDRGDLKLQWTCHTNGAVLANGLEKTVLAGGDGLKVLNRYSGGVIWQDEKPYNNIALYHERIFASDALGTIRAFNGAPNISGPVTELRIEPVSPDGSEGWYTRQPVIEIISADRETYTTAILMQHNNGPWEDAPASLSPEDGTHRITAYGTDSRGLRGTEENVQFKVDTGLPESIITLSPAEPENGWYNQAITLTLNAWDDVSGIDWIWTSRSAYSEPMFFADQGIHRFSWHALDHAGNREEQRRRDIRIDLTPPYAEVSVVYDQGLGELTINARDSLSGAAFIEYRINKDTAERYRDPLVFTEPGAYQVHYRAADRAGNISLWQTCDVVVSPAHAGLELIDTPSINGMPRPVMNHARNRMPLIKGAEDGAIANLPSYTVGADYLLWEEDDALLDESARIRFRVKRNAVVYLFLPQNTAAPRSWSFVEDKAAINRRYYPGGAAVYMKRYGPSGLVEIPGTPGGTVQPLIMVQEKGSVSAEILIHPVNAEDTGDENAFVLDALVKPWQYSRRLPLRKRWFVHAGEDWTPLEGNRCEVSAPVEKDEETVSVPLRFRLELYTPDGEVEYRVEKVYGVAENF
ncbi:hypothetical protein AGMMS49940_22900 [Spirochaetia bacterium]|nr:hypothetical protein AGMMS49940_22900 [Spirochaetia bacterium]